ncbi:MAG: asparagine synthetase B [Bacteroidales bacterium]|nr:asparagine synthetase B [Bacteroidales bacterium]
MLKKNIYILLVFLLITCRLQAAYILIPMDNAQRNHLKAYGIAYWVLEQEVEVDWLLNYRGGSFMMRHSPQIVRECRLRGVTYQVIATVQAEQIRRQIAEPDVNMDIVTLHKAPRIAVYSPPNMLPWNDAVTLVLTYAQIPFDIVYDDEVLAGVLPMYDWLHLHHEDFTGQRGKFWAAFRNVPWYQEEVRRQEENARRLGFTRVADMKLATALKIRDFVAGGGFLFAMCSAPESLDVALAAEGIDIVAEMFDGTPIDPDAQERLDFTRTFAFRDFTIVKDPFKYAISNIDVTHTRPRNLTRENDLFTLFEFSAKWDWVPTMLTQNHTRIIHGFMGQTTAFNKDFLKPNVIILGANAALNEARLIHGTLGNGMWTFFGGHDPEDYQHFVGDPPTNLDLFPNSPGYRLILNNVLFPAARREQRRT